MSPHRRSPHSWGRAQTAHATTERKPDGHRAGTAWWDYDPTSRRQAWRDCLRERRGYGIYPSGSPTGNGK
eukprot:14833032-Alexandrium_andersonii.AAC.1